MRAIPSLPSHYEGLPLAPADARLRELEAENARLKSLIGELLVRNQQLRETVASQETAAARIAALHALKQAMKPQ